MKKQITPFRVAACLVGALVVTFIVLLKIPSGDYLLMPDPAHPVAPLVRVVPSKPTRDKGKIFFVDVQERQASELEKLFPWIHPHSTLVPANVLIPPGSNDQAVQAAGRRQMSTSQQVAAAVALRHLGYDVHVVPNGVLVNQLIEKTDAVGKLQPTDLIVALNGHPTMTIAALRAIMAKVRPGQWVTLRVTSGKVLRTVKIRAVGKGGRTLIGIAPVQSAEIKLPIKVSIDSGDIVGPSAGLAFTLEVMRQLGADVTHGYRVAATGEINLDGTVGPIGGIEQKTWGVRDAGAQIFLVPVGDNNARDARKFAGPDLKIIPVTSFEQALRALAALPPAPEK